MLGHFTNLWRRQWFSICFLGAARAQVTHIFLEAAGGAAGRREWCAGASRSRLYTYLLVIYRYYLWTLQKEGKHESLLLMNTSNKKKTWITALYTFILLRFYFYLLVIRVEEKSYEAKSCGIRVAYLYKNFIFYWQ